MPRQPIGDQAMTGAERQRRWRERLRRERGPVSDKSAREALTKARQEIDRLRQQLAAATARPRVRQQQAAAEVGPSSQKIDMLRDRFMGDISASLRAARP